MSHNDPWCQSVALPNGRKISGAAAREYRISQYERGNETIIRMAVESASRMVLEDSNARAQTARVLSQASASAASTTRQLTPAGGSLDDWDDE